MIKAIIGPMFGSKSSRLIDIALDLEKEGKKFKKNLKFSFQHLVIS